MIADICPFCWARPEVALITRYLACELCQFHLSIFASLFQFARLKRLYKWLISVANFREIFWGWLIPEIEFRRRSWWRSRKICELFEKNKNAISGAYFFPAARASSSMIAKSAAIERIKSWSLKQLESKTGATGIISNNNWTLSRVSKIHRSELWKRDQKIKIRDFQNSVRFSSSKS